jgi:hypothetical protein
VSNAAAAVTHKHVAVNEPDGAAGEHVLVILHKVTGCSLIHIVILPVFGWCVVPLADGISRKVNDVAVVEAGDEVNTADDICRIKETERALFVGGDKLDTIQPLCFPPCPMFLVDLKPTDPENVHVFHRFQVGMKNLHSEDPEDSCVQIWVGGVAVRECHYIRATPHVDLVHMSLEVIGSVIHAHRIPLFETVTVDVDLIALGIREVGRFGIILLVKDAGEEVVQ